MNFRNEQKPFDPHVQCYIVQIAFRQLKELGHNKIELICLT